MLSALAQSSPATQPGAALPWRLSEEMFLGNPLWKWVAVVVVLVGAVLLGRLISYGLARRGRALERSNKARLLGLTLQSWAGPISLLMIAGGMHIGGKLLVLSYSLPGLYGDEKLELNWLWQATVQTLSVVAVGWALYRMVSVFEAIFQRWAKASHTGMEERMIPIIRKIVRSIIVIIVLLFIVQNVFNWNIAALLAGFGLTGLAVALAAQDALKNFFGSVAIFADQPFHIGDWVKIESHEGYVEEVGFRSSRIRTLDSSLVVIPNSIIAGVAVQNFSRGNVVRRVVLVNLKEQDDPAKVARALELISALLESRKAQLRKETPYLVTLQELAPTGLTINASYWFTPADWRKLQSFHSDLCLEIHRSLSAAGIKINLPI